jgi:predicted DNA-binding transcriptional regulator YafY
MRNSIDAPIEYSALHRGYYYSEAHYRVPAGFSRAEDLLALGMAKNILSLYKDTPLYEPARRLLDSITAPLAADSTADWFENRIVTPPVPSAPIAPELWNAIIAGLKENRVLTFDYQGTLDENYRPRRIRPYQLLFDTGVWYLYGFAEDRKATRIFSLSRIKNIALAREHFSLPQHFDYRRSSGGSHFGIFAGQKKLRFSIAFYDESVLWVKERTWADDQKLAETDGCVIISFTSTQYHKVLEWVLSRGGAAEPLEPESLVNDWRKQIEEMYKLAEI